MVSKPYYIVICVLVCVFRLTQTTVCYHKKKKSEICQERKKGRKEEKAIRGTSHTRCETYHKAFIIKQWGMDTWIDRPVGKKSPKIEWNI